MLLHLIMKYEKKILVITPCHLENYKLILQNVNSVDNQIYCNVEIDHKLIFDGVEINKNINNNVKNSKISILRTKFNHSDYGDYVRRLGTKLAIMKNYLAVTYLDADNFWESNHLKKVLEHYFKTKKNIIISKRFLIDNKNFKKKEDDSNFFDSNTFTFFGDWGLLGKVLEAVFLRFWELGKMLAPS